MVDNSPAETSGAVERDETLRWLWGTGSLAIIVLGVYGQVLSFGLIDTWDDSLYFLSRPEVTDWFAASWSQRLLTPELGYPVPLPTLLYHLVRQAPASLVVPAAHGLNLIFHLANTLLVFALARRWIKRFWPAWLVAIIWSVHPLMAEPVSWITNLKFVSMGTFCLAGVYSWDHYLKKQPDGDLRWAGAAVGCVIAALSCQPQALALGPALVAQAFFHSGQARWTSWRMWGPIALMAVISAVYLPTALGGQHELLHSANIENVYEMPLADTALRVGAAFSLQAEHVVWPVGLQPAYFPPKSELAVIGTSGLAVMLFALMVTAVAVWKRHCTAWPLVFGWMFYVPVSGIDFLPRLTADPYMYLPLFGIVVAVVMAANGLIEQLQGRFSLVIVVVLAAGLLGEAALSVVQARRWRNVVALMVPTLEAYPEWPMGYSILGNAYARAQEPERALAVFEEGVDTMYEYGTLPLEMPRLYEAVGKPAHAANILMLMSRYRGRKPPFAEAELLRLMVTHKLPIAGDDGRKQVIREVLARGIEDAPKMRSARWLVATAAHFAARQEVHLAQAALDAAVRARSQDCQWWDEGRELVHDVPELQWSGKAHSCSGAQ